MFVHCAMNDDPFEGEGGRGAQGVANSNFYYSITLVNGATQVRGLGRIRGSDFCGRATP